MLGRRAGETAPCVWGTGRGTGRGWDMGCSTPASTQDKQGIWPLSPSPHSNLLPSLLPAIVGNKNNPCTRKLPSDGARQANTPPPPNTYRVKEQLQAPVRGRLTAPSHRKSQSLPPPACKHPCIDAHGFNIDFLVSRNFRLPGRFLCTQRSAVCVTIPI